MAFSVPKISDILSLKIQDIQSRLPLRMAGREIPESLSFASELSAAQTAAEPSSVQTGETLSTVQPAGDLLFRLQTSGETRGTAGKVTWPRLDATALESVMPRIDTAIEQSAVMADIDPLLLRALIRQESSFQPFSLSPAGAMGLTQLMPGTAGDLGVTQPYDIEENISGGARYLRQQLDAFGNDLSLALAAYNAGPNAVLSYGGIPPYPETIGFVEKVIDSYRLYQAAAR